MGSDSCFYLADGGRTEGYFSFSYVSWIFNLPLGFGPLRLYFSYSILLLIHQWNLKFSREPLRQPCNCSVIDLRACRKIGKHVGTYWCGAFGSWGRRAGSTVQPWELSRGGLGVVKGIQSCSGPQNMAANPGENCRWFLFNFYVWRTQLALSASIFSAVGDHILTSFLKSKSCFALAVLIYLLRLVWACSCSAKIKNTVSM